MKKNTSPLPDVKKYSDRAKKIVTLLNGLTYREAVTALKEAKLIYQSTSLTFEG